MIRSTLLTWECSLEKQFQIQIQRIKENGQLYAWQDYIEHCGDIIFKRQYRASTIICVNDPYGKIDSKKHDGKGKEGEW